MRVPLSWLQEYVDLPTDDGAELGRALDMIGHNVEALESVEPGWEGVLVARVETVEAHPDADKIRLCTVTVGDAPIEVVCGAWNFEPGDVVAWAQPGAVLPGGFEIGVRTIRGVESHGMICSENELGLGEDAEGILVLDDTATIGEPLESALSLPETVFDLEITPNRPDAMSMYGIARDLAAWYDVTASPPRPDPPAVGGDVEVSVAIEDPIGNPRFTARQLDGVEVRQSPMWMRQRLRLAGVRPISNLVDITNYVMLELGHPLHVFDADKIAGGQLLIRRAEEGEQLTTLDGVDRTLTTDDLVIADSKGPTSLAGTMGGERSEVSGTTTSTLIEAASWDPPTVMYMARRHGLRSEASARFERGVDPDLPPLATLRAAELMLATAGGQLRAGSVDVIARPIEPVHLELPVANVQRVLDDRFTSKSVTGILARLGFEVSGQDPLSVGVPTFRPDVTRPADLVEEVARIAGFDTFDSRLRLGSGGGLTDHQQLSRRIRQWLAAGGYSQAVSLTFVMPEEIDAFDPPPNHELRRFIQVKNPLSAEESLLRTSLLPGLLRVVRHNRSRGMPNVAVFEQGRVFHHLPWSDDRRVPAQPNRIALAVTGVVGPAALNGAGQEADVHWITGVLRAMGHAMSLDLSLEQATAPGFHPTRTAAVLTGGDRIGFAGELHPMTARFYDITGRTAVAELDLDRLIESRTPPQYRPVSPYPPVDFDLSFEVASDLPAAKLADTVRSAGGDVLERTRVFDEFHGESVGKDRKALAISVRLRAPDRTLAADEIAEIRHALIDSAVELGATLRGSERGSEGGGA